VAEPAAGGNPMRLALGITGASGAAYGLEILRRAVARGAQVELVVSDWGRVVLAQECGVEYDPERPGGGLVTGEAAGRVRCHPVGDMRSPLASGSSDWEAMCIAPCSVGTVGRIAAGTGDNLLVRAAAVALKERRRLVVVPRETPLGLIELHNLVTLAEAGAVVLPAMPAFYEGPQTVADLVGFIAERALGQLGLGEARR